MTQEINISSTDATIDVAPAPEGRADIEEVITTIFVDGGPGEQLISIDAPVYAIEASSSTTPNIDAGFSTHEIHISGDSSSGEASGALKSYVDAQDDLHSADDRAYADAQDDSHSADDRAYADAQDDSHSADDRAYADAQDDSHSADDRAYADAQDDSHSADDRAYADAQDDSHSADDRAYTDAQNVSHSADDRAYADAQDDSHSADDRAYTDTGLSGKLDLSGGTLTGSLTLAATSGVNQLVMQSSSSDTRQFINFKDSAGTQQFIIWQDQAAKIFQITTEAALAGSRVISMKIDQTGAVEFNGAPAVTVPDAAADGEALAYGQSGAILQGLSVSYNSPTYGVASLGSTQIRRSTLTEGGTLLKVMDGDGTTRFEVRGTNVIMDGADYVKVPAASSYGEALAFGQAGAELSDLNVEYDSSAYARLQSGSAVFKRNATGSDQSVLRVVDGSDTSVLWVYCDGSVDMSDALSVSVPDLTATGTLDVDGQTTLDRLTATGFSYFSQSGTAIQLASGSTLKFAGLGNSNVGLLSEVSGVMVFNTALGARFEGGYLSVPDATADGEALAYGQADAELAGLTVATSSGNALIDLESTGSNVTQVRFVRDSVVRSILTTDGSTGARLFVQTYDSGGSYQGNIAEFNADTNAVRFNGASSVEVPDAAADGEALAHSQNNAVLGNNTELGTTTATGVFEFHAASSPADFAKFSTADSVDHIMWIRSAGVDGEVFALVPSAAGGAADWTKELGYDFTDAEWYVDSAFTVGGNLTITNSIDGGLVAGLVSNDAYNGLRTANMAAAEYMIMSDGGHTYISGGTGSNTYIRAGGNNFAAQLAITPGGATFSGALTVGGATQFDDYIEQAAATIVAGNTVLNEMRLAFEGTGQRWYMAPKEDGTYLWNNEFGYNFATDQWYSDTPLEIAAPVSATDAVQKQQLDDHINDISDAHDASAISFDGTLLSPISKAWHPDTIDDLQDSNTTIIAEIDGRISAGDTDAIIDAINDWDTGDSTISNSDVFEAEVIVTDALAAGAVVASKIAANTITADKLNVGRIGDSLVANGDFSGDLAGTWLCYEGSTDGLSRISGEDGTPVNGAYMSHQAASSSRIVSTAFAVERGKRYVVGMWVRSDNVDNDTIYIRLRTMAPAVFEASGLPYVTKTGSAIETVTQYNVLPVGWSDWENESQGDITSWTYTEAEFDLVGSDRTVASLSILNWANSKSKLDIAGVTVREQIGSTTIKDGAVTTDKIFANAVTANEIASGTITATEIAAGAITADEIAVGTIGGGNLVENSNFESATGGKQNSYYGGSNAWEEDGGRLQGHAWKFISDGNNAHDSGGIVYTSPASTPNAYHDVGPGKPTTVSGWVKFEDVGLQIVVGVRYTDSVTGIYITQSVVHWPVLSTGDWQYVQHTHTRGSDFVNRIGFECMVDGADNATPRTMYFDEIQIERGELATPWRPHTTQVTDGSIVGTYIADGAVTTDKIFANAVTADKISVNDLEALNATIAGWDINEATLTSASDKITLDNSGVITVGSLANSDIVLTGGATAAATTMTLGAATTLANGTGIFMDGAGSFRVGNTNLLEYIEFNASTGKIEIESEFFQVTPAGDVYLGGQVLADTMSADGFELRSGSDKLMTVDEQTWPFGLGTHPQLKFWTDSGQTTFGELTWFYGDDTNISMFLGEINYSNATSYGFRYTNDNGTLEATINATQAGFQAHDTYGATMDAGFSSLNVAVDGSITLAPYDDNVVVEAGLSDFSGAVKLNTLTGVDGGLRMGTWTGSSPYNALSTGNMTGNEYVLLSNGSSTLLGAGSGGTTYIRGGANSSTYQLAISPSAATFASDLTVGGHVYLGSSKVYSWSADSNTYIHSNSNDAIGLVCGSATKLYLQNNGNQPGATIYQNSTANNTGPQAALHVRTASAASIPVGGIAGIAIWTQYSTDRHVHQRVYYADGDVLSFRNWENTAGVPLYASAFTNVSTKAEKNRIRTAREERGVLDYAVAGPRKLAFKQHRKVRPVLFDDLKQERLHLWAGCDIHETREECEEAGCENKDATEEVLHQCDEYECGGTAESPCDLVARHVDRVGLIAEEIAEIWPKAVSRDMHGVVKGIDYAVVTVELLNTVSHLLEDRDEQRGITAREILSRRRLQRQLTDSVGRIEMLETRLDALQTGGSV